MNNSVYLADLTHTGSGVSAYTFPLGTALVASYAQQVLGDRFDFKLFKFPETLASTVFETPPLVLAFSNYSWNLELSYKLAVSAKKQFPSLIVISGGPNYPVLETEKYQFLTKRTAIDFYIEYEGEVAFVELLQKLEQYQFNVSSLRTDMPLITNCSYMNETGLVSGPTQRIPDINIIPSPYLNGLLDEFFFMPLVPMIETARGCPFSCSFCADGLIFKSKVKKYDTERTQAELRYMAERVQNVDELFVTDLNFGMLKGDIDTAKYIAEVQNEFHWPTVVGASAGKNQPERVKEVAAILKGSWIAGGAIQSTDEEVLRNIKRSNISKEAYYELTQFINDQDTDALTYSEIILALPGDTKQKHFESLRYTLSSGVDSVLMYQAIMLVGTEMASQHYREKFGLLTKFRIIPGTVGKYQFGGSQFPVAEIEEIIVGSKDMPIDDYVQCRLMNLFIETYFNNSLCEEVFGALKAIELSVFDFFVYLHENDDLYTPQIRNILSSFVKHTKEDLYDSFEEAERSALSADLFDKYVAGELGCNELVMHKALLYLQFDDTIGVLMEAVKRYLKSEGQLIGETVEYFDDLKKYIEFKKKDILNADLVTTETFQYDFKAIEALNFQVDPRNINKTPNGVRLTFFHAAPQREHIQNSVNLYLNHPGGIGRMLYRSNLKKMFRSVEQL